MAVAAGITAVASGGVKAYSAMKGAANQSAALKAKGAFEQQQADTNARLLEMQGEDALRIGDLESSSIRSQGKQAAGAQKVSAAASGIDATSGSAGVAQEESLAMSQRDAQTVKNNAWREAWGFKVKAADTRNQGKFSNTAAQNEAKSTLAAGGMQAASSVLDAATSAAGYKRKG